MARTSYPHPTAASGRIRRWTGLLAGAATLALPLVGLGALPAAAATGAEYRVDCGAADAGADGSADHPYTTLAEVNALALQPGDALLFARGTTCTGTLSPHGSGSADAPIVVGAYGDGAAPVIDGAGAHDAVLLKDIEHITVQDLAITNAANPGTERNGIRLSLTDFGKASGYVLQRLDVHDVMGDDNKGLNGSAAIQIGIGGKSTPTWIDGLQIRDSTITHVGREGIYFKSTWNKRPEVGSQDTSGLGPWTPSTGVVIAGNTLTSVAGDGIKVDTTKGAVIEHNILAGFQLRSAVANAGIWPFNADDTLVQYNDVSGGGNSHDGMSFDADGGSQNTVFQYNYSHDNAGGLLLVCPYSGARTWGTVFRYNMSYDDAARVFQLCPGNIQDTHIYNNTIVDEHATPTYFLQDDNSTSRGVTFSNNIMVNRGAPMGVQVRGPGLSFDHNLFIGVTGVPANADGAVNPGGLGDDPGFVEETHKPTGLDDLGGLGLRQFSPAFRAGLAVADNGGRDITGTPVPESGPVNLGADQGVGAHTDPSAVLRMPSVSAAAGLPVTVHVTATFWGAKPTRSATAALQAPDGWTVTPVQASVPDGLKSGASAELSWTVTPPADAAEGTATLTATVTAGDGLLGSVATDAKVRALFASVEAAYNDVAITADGASPYTGDLALSRSSLSSNELLKAKGIAPGATVQGAKVAYTWPQFTPGQKNAVWASGQSIAVHGQGTALGLVVFGVNAYPTPVSGTASVTYTDGSTSSFTLAAGDYYYNQPATGNTLFTKMAYRNTPGGKGNGPFSLFESTIPIDGARQVAYVTLPQRPAYTDGKTPGLLVLAIGVG